MATRLLFEFLVLAVVRTAEARGALWSEFDYERSIWLVPAERVKTRKSLVVPLSERALAVLREARESPHLREARARGGVGDLVFPTQNGRVFYNNALPKMLRSLDVAAVPHGFRSSFASWCGNNEVHPDVRERCLSHVVGNQTVESYMRDDLRRYGVPQAPRRDASEARDFFIARGQALSAHGRGDRSQPLKDELRGLRDEAERVGLRLDLPALEAALSD